MWSLESFLCVFFGVEWIFVVEIGSYFSNLGKRWWELSWGDICGMEKEWVWGIESYCELVGKNEGIRKVKFVYKILSWVECLIFLVGEVSFGRKILN